MSPPKKARIAKDRIVCRCERLEKLIKSISPAPHNHLAFLGRVHEIAGRVSTDTDQALKELDSLEDALKNAPDGHGSVILTSERHEKYLV